MGHGLPQLQAYHPEADDGDRLGKGLLLEHVVRRDHAVAERLPGLWHDRPRAGGEHDAAGAKTLAFNLEQVGLDELRVALDEELLAHLVRAVGEDPVDEGVAHVLDVLHHLGVVDGDVLLAGAPVPAEDRRPVEVLRDLDERLGGHAPHPGAGRPRFAAVDQDETPARGLDAPQRVEAGAARTDYRHVHSSLFHDLLRRGFPG